MKDKLRATITKKKDTVVIEISNNWYEHMCEESKALLESVAKEWTLEKTLNTFPILGVLMGTPVVIKDLKPNDKMHL